MNLFKARVREGKGTINLLEEARTEDNDKTELKYDFSISHSLYNRLTL